MIPLRDDIPSQQPAIMSWALLVANVAAFAWQVDTGLERSVQVGGAIPYELLTFSDVGFVDLVRPPLTVFTSMFLHGGLLHLASNMLFLWVFANNVEDALGRLRFLAFYLACGAAAAVAQTLATAVTAAGLLPGEASLALNMPMVGASGAIAGVLGAYLRLYPRARVSTLFIFFIIPKIIDVSALLFIGGWFLLQLAAVFFGGAPGVAVFAHIGGFLAGFLLVRVVGRREGWHPWSRPAWLDRA